MPPMVELPRFCLLSLPPLSLSNQQLSTKPWDCQTFFFQFLFFSFQQFHEPVDISFAAVVISLDSGHRVFSVEVPLKEELERDGGGCRASPPRRLASANVLLAWFLASLLAVCAFGRTLAKEPKEVEHILPTYGTQYGVVSQQPVLTEVSSKSTMTVCESNDDFCETICFCCLDSRGIIPNPTQLLAEPEHAHVTGVMSVGFLSGPLQCN